MVPVQDGFIPADDPAVAVTCKFKYRAIRVIEVARLTRWDSRITSGTRSTYTFSRLSSADSHFGRSVTAPLISNSVSLPSSTSSSWRLDASTRCNLSFCITATSLKLARKRSVPPECPETCTDEEHTAKLTPSDPIVENLPLDCLHWRPDCVRDPLPYHLRNTLLLLLVLHCRVPC